jgi:prepilin-type N-terminal cleavage/methylation domain-containing protein
MLKLEPSKAEVHLLNDQGFTLIEVIIAITVLSFISFSTYQMIDNSSNAKENVTKEDQQIIQTLTVVGRIDSDISQIYNPLFSSSKATPGAASANNPYAAEESSTPNGSFDGKTKSGALIPQFKSEDKSSIIFFTQANRRKMADTKESRFLWVRYGVQPKTIDPDQASFGEESKNTAQYELIRQIIPTDIYSPTLDWTKAKVQVVLENVKSVEFSFWDERSKKFTTSIQELNENKNLIRSIKIDLVWVNSDNNEQKIEKIFRVLNPYFNTKQDDLKSGAGVLPPGTPNPQTPVQPGEEEEAE